MDVPLSCCLRCLKSPGRAADGVSFGCVVDSESSLGALSLDFDEEIFQDETVSTHAARMRR